MRSVSVITELKLQGGKSLSIYVSTKVTMWPRIIGLQLGFFKERGCNLLGEATARLDLLRGGFLEKVAFLLELEGRYRRVPKEEKE